MADFPIGLPDPISSGYSGSKTKAFIRTEMESGNPRQRQRFSATNQTRAMSWIFNADEMYIFKTFFEVGINQGTDYFNISLNLGDGFLTYQARFTEPYNDSFIDGGYWSVSGSLEVNNA